MFLKLVKNILKNFEKSIDSITYVW